MMIIVSVCVCVCVTYVHTYLLGSLVSDSISSSSSFERKKNLGK